jgi:thiamine kinase-like enzyme
MTFGSSKPQQPLEFTAAMDSINSILQKDPEVVPCILKAMQNLIKMREKGIFHNDVTLNNIMFPSGEWVDFEYATSSADEKHKNISQLSSLENNPEKDVNDFSTILGIIIDKYKDSPQYKDQINLLSTVQASLETVKEKDEKKKVTKEDCVSITLPLLKSAEKSLNQIRIELDASKDEKLQHLSRNNKIG